MSGGWGTQGAAREPDAGETFVNGATPENARGLLAACDTLGITRQVVRTVAHGFIVPSEVYDQYAQTRADTAGI